MCHFFFESQLRESALLLWNNFLKLFQKNVRYNFFRKMPTLNIKENYFTDWPTDRPKLFLRSTRQWTARPYIWVTEFLRIKGKQPLTEKLTDSIESFMFIWHTEQEYQWNLNQGKIHIQRDSKEDLKYCW